MWDELSCLKTLVIMLMCYNAALIQGTVTTFSTYFFSLHFYTAKTPVSDTTISTFNNVVIISESLMRSLDPHGMVKLPIPILNDNRVIWDDGVEEVVYVVAAQSHGPLHCLLPLFRVASTRLL
jgi:hypothetical protein